MQDKRKIQFCENFSDTETLKFRFIWSAIFFLCLAFDTFCDAQCSSFFCFDSSRIPGNHSSQANDDAGSTCLTFYSFVRIEQNWTRFWEIFPRRQNVLRVYLQLGRILNLLWRIFMLLNKFSMLQMAKYGKNNQAIFLKVLLPVWPDG